MLKLKLQYFGHLMWRADSFEKTLMLGKIEGRRRRGWQRMRWLDGITNSVDMGLGRLWQLVMGQGGLACCSSWGGKDSDTTGRLNWTELSFLITLIYLSRFTFPSHFISFLPEKLWYFFCCVPAGEWILSAIFMSTKVFILTFFFEIYVS